MTAKIKLCALTSGILAIIAGCAFATGASADTAISNLATQETTAPLLEFAIFAPKRQTKTTRIDYTVFDDALRNIVIDFGDSLRTRAGRPSAETGTRFVRGHTSPYRLEGSRVTFSRLHTEYIEQLTAYRQDLERVGTDIDLTHFSRNEQLAFWFNLHNVTLIEQIALKYPVRTPAKLKVKVAGEKYLIHDAKILNIKGVPLSLRNIREDIVANNWSDSAVIYGFFMGNVGSPRLNEYAFTGENVDRVLRINAGEFVNSLRGFNERKSHRNVSHLYKDYSRFYFRDFDTNVIDHLNSYATDAVKIDLAVNKPVRVEPLEGVLADLTGGNGVTALSRSDSPLMSSDMSRLLREVKRKWEIQQQRGLINNSRGVVIIEDLVPEADKAKTLPPSGSPVNTDPE